MHSVNTKYLKFPFLGNIWPTCRPFLSAFELINVPPGLFGADLLPKGWHGLGQVSSLLLVSLVLHNWSVVFCILLG